MRTYVSGKGFQKERECFFKYQIHLQNFLLLDITTPISLTDFKNKLCKFMEDKAVIIVIYYFSGSEAFTRKAVRYIRYPLF